MVSLTAEEQATPIRAGAVILASASLCPADPDLVWAPLDGRPLLAWSIATCLAAKLDPIILVVAPDHREQANALMESMAPQGTPDMGTVPGPRWRVVTPAVRGRLTGAILRGERADSALAGGTPPNHVGTGPSGERRRDATLAGTAALLIMDRRCVWMVVHEATRPLASAPLIRTGLAAAVNVGAGAIAVEPVKETLKRAPDGVGGLVAETLPRAQLARAQTPQVYRVVDMLAALYRLPPDADPADEASVAFAAGLPLVTFSGGHDNLRAMTRADLPVIASLLDATPR